MVCLKIPTYVVDAPDGGGKIPVMPDYTISQGNTRVVLRNFEGVITTCEEPTNYVSVWHCEDCEKQIGVSALLSGQKMTIEPDDLERNLRKKRLSKWY